MKAVRKIIAGAMAAVIGISSAAVCYAEEKVQSENEITVMVKGKNVKFPDQKPIIKNDRTLVPVRFIAEYLGYDVEWNQKDNSAVIDGGRIIFYIGTDQAVINGMREHLDTVSELIGDRTMIPLRTAAETLGCTVDWFGENRKILVNPRNSGGIEKSVFERLKQSGLFWNYSRGNTEYLIPKNKYDTLSEASDPSNFSSWWVERCTDADIKENADADCSIMMRSFGKKDLFQVKGLFYTVYPTKADEAYEIMMKTICGELWETFRKEESELYPLYSAMPAFSGTFGTTYYDGRQVEMYCNSTGTRLNVKICREGYENPETPRELTRDEIDFYTAQAKKNYCLEMWDLK